MNKLDEGRSVKGQRREALGGERSGMSRVFTPVGGADRDR